MSIDCTQLKEVIINPAIKAIGLYSEEAVNLLLGTCAQESQLGKYLVQMNITSYKGGIGIYQMEGKSYEYIWNKHIESSFSMKAKVKLYLGFNGMPQASRMASDLSLATIMARLYYANILERLPKEDDVEAMARYYKVYWNTMQGKGTQEQFIENYRKYVT